MNSIAASSHSSLGAATRAGTSAASTKGLAALLMAAVVAALVVVADQLIDSWADGHIFVVWVAWWALVFGVTMAFAGTARRTAQRTMAALNTWSQRAAQRRAEARLWEIAKADPRVMSELVAAQQREVEPVAVQRATREELAGVEKARAAMEARGRHLYYI